MNEFLLMLSISLFFLLFFVIKKNSRKNILYKNKFQTPFKVLKKINSFKGEHKAARIMSYLKKTDPYVFERLLLTTFRKQGFNIRRKEKYSEENGVIRKMYKGNQLYFIQAKHYSGYVKKQQVLNFIETVNQHNASGFFIHTGITGENIFHVIQGSRVEILSGSKLINMLLQ